jgi:hypothetical protein
MQVHPIPFRTLQRLRPRGFYLLRKSLADVPGLTNTIAALDQARETASQERIVELADERSTVLTFRHLKQRHGEIAELIERWAPCPDSVAFYIAWDQSVTIIIPTVEILRNHYFPGGDTLEHFLTATERGPFVGHFAAFDGFKYISPNSDQKQVCYPVRAQRNLPRAEHEIRQLMPRAVAYHRRYGDGLPILIRPPFVGKVRVEGNALTQSVESIDLVFFPFGCSFAPPVTPRQSTYIEKAFAPNIGRRSASLEALRCGVKWWSSSFKVEACDIRIFPRMARAIANAHAMGRLKLPPRSLLHDDNFDCLREWILRTNRI